MTFRPHPVHYTKEEFANYVDSLSFDSWRPLYGVHHCTGIPDLQMWLSGGPTPQQRIENMSNYWKSLKWHSAPQIVNSPEYIFETCYLNQDGVHCSCSGANSHSIGMENVGSYETDAWDSGPGALVRDNAVWAWAVIHKKLGWKPDPVLLWKKGIHYHSWCGQDGHTTCPGKNVDRPDLVRRILQTMDQLSLMKPVATDPPMVTAPTMTASRILHLGLRGDDVGAIQKILNLTQDDNFGPQTEAAVQKFQKDHGLTPDGFVGSLTLAALQAEKTP